MHSSSSPTGQPPSIPYRRSSYLQLTISIIDLSPSYSSFVLTDCRTSLKSHGTSHWRAPTLSRSQSPLTDSLETYPTHNSYGHLEETAHLYWISLLQNAPSTTSLAVLCFPDTGIGCRGQYRPPSRPPEARLTSIQNSTTTTTLNTSTCSRQSIAACPTPYDPCCAFVCAEAQVPFDVCSPSNETFLASCYACAPPTVTPSATTPLSYMVSSSAITTG